VVSIVAQRRAVTFLQCETTVLLTVRSGAGAVSSLGHFKGEAISVLPFLEVN
jgi:hypothetical protein